MKRDPSNEEIRRLVDAGKSFTVKTNNARKFAKTIGGKKYFTRAAGNGFDVIRLPDKV